MTEERNYTNGWITTYSGVRFWPLDPNPADIHIEDIAHHLSQQCRWAGGTRVFYSTSQHSVLVSLCCDPDDALDGLLHDASEAYLSDIVRPLKHSPELAGYRAVEARMMAAVRQRFGLKAVQPDSVYWADDFVMRAERRDLIAPVSDFVLTGPTMAATIVPVSPLEAEAAFLSRFLLLTNKYPEDCNGD